jgi:hypothetical protein
MSDRILKLLSQEIALTTAQTMNGAQLIRLHNPNGSELSVIIRDTADNIVGSMTLSSKETVVIRKKAEETIETTSTCRAVIIAFGD